MTKLSPRKLQFKSYVQMNCKTSEWVQFENSLECLKLEEPETHKVPLGYKARRNRPFRF